MKQTLIFVTWLYALGPLSTRIGNRTQSEETPLILVQREKTIVSPIAEKWEQKATEDLAHFIELMTSVKIPVINKHDVWSTSDASNWTYFRTTNKRFKSRQSTPTPIVR